MRSHFSGLREAAVNAAAVDVEKAGGFGDVAAGLFEGALDEGVLGGFEVEGKVGDDRGR